MVEIFIFIDCKNFKMNKMMFHFRTRILIVDTSSCILSKENVELNKNNKK